MAKPLIPGLQLYDGDTTYILSSSVNQRDLYTMGSLSSTPVTIEAIKVSSFAKKETRE